MFHQCVFWLYTFIHVTLQKSPLIWDKISLAEMEFTAVARDLVSNYMLTGGRGAQPSPRQLFLYSQYKSACGSS